MIGISRRYALTGEETLFYAWLNLLKQIFPLQIGAGLTIRKATALVRSRLMNGTALYHFVLCLKNTGTILSYLECILIFQVPFSDLTVRNSKMTGQPVNIGSCQKQRGPI